MNKDKVQKVSRRVGIVLGLIPLVAISIVYALGVFGVHSNAEVGEFSYVLYVTQKIAMLVAIAGLWLLPVAVALGLTDLGIAISKRKNK